MATDNQADQALSDRLRRGDPGAAEELFARYFRQVYSVVFYTVGRDQTAAEDITQDTFLSAVRAAGRFKGKSKPYTWLLSIAHHKIADYYRQLSRKRRYEIQSLDSPTGSPDNIPDNSEPPYSRLESAELGAVVTRALSRLPHHYREVLIYRYVEEMPVKQISRVMKRSPKSVEALLTRARSILKNELDKISEG